MEAEKGNFTRFLTPASRKLWDAECRSVESSKIALLGFHRLQQQSYLIPAVVTLFHQSNLQNDFGRSFIGNTLLY